MLARGRVGGGLAQVAEQLVREIDGLGIVTCALCLGLGLAADLLSYSADAERTGQELTGIARRAAGRSTGHRRTTAGR
jgi:hypothetical protein